MKIQFGRVNYAGGLLFLAILSCSVAAQQRSYAEMSASERAGFVGDQARRLSLELSGEEYVLTPEFTLEIQKSVDYYAGRIGGTGKRDFGLHDTRLIFERGNAIAPGLSRVFRSRKLSPLYGIYIAAIESGFVNIATPNRNGAAGMFQFTPATARRFGLAAIDVLDTDKSADAAARYIQENLEKFGSSSTSSALAILSYNRGEEAVRRDLAAVVNEQNKSCSICALTSARQQLDKSFQNESVNYVPMFFAAAIVGENPEAFGLNIKPLSSLEGN